MFSIASLVQQEHLKKASTNRTFVPAAFHSESEPNFETATESLISHLGSKTTGDYIYRPYGNKNGLFVFLLCVLFSFICIKHQQQQHPSISPTNQKSRNYPKTLTHQPLNESHYYYAD